jgi:peptidoglycan/LPS O-acetylase OafA/YrhL
MPNQRFHEIDLLRGLACLAVVAYHYLWRGQDAGWVSTHAHPAIEALARYGYLGVHLFFMVSGFVILMSAQGSSLRSFAASRVARLYPALWIAAPLTAAVAWAFHRAEFEVSLPTVLANMTMLPHWLKVAFVDGAYWSLAVELQFYLLVALVVAFKGLKRPEGWVAGWLLVSAVNAVRPTYPLEFWLAVKWAPLFCAGMCFYLLRTRGASPVRLGLIALSWVLAVVYEAGPDLRSVAGAAPQTVVAWVDAVVLTAFYALFLAFAAGRFHVERSGLAVWAGLMTYPVYLLHQNIGYVLLGALAPVGLSFGLRVLLTVVAIGTAAWAIVVFVERPIGPQLRRWVRGPVDSAGPRDRLRVQGD